ncbi:MAG: hypothetical protein MJZ82_02015 [Paludibacteraceae bacterium]|nr:hypothetical protein [Paludibacteraceae bacterium]
MVKKQVTRILFVLSILLMYSCQKYDTSAVPFTPPSESRPNDELRMPLQCPLSIEWQRVNVMPLPVVSDNIKYKTENSVYSIAAIFLQHSKLSSIVRFSQRLVLLFTSECIAFPFSAFW